MRCQSFELFLTLALLSLGALQFIALLVHTAFANAQPDFQIVDRSLAELLHLAQLGFVGRFATRQLQLFMFSPCLQSLKRCKGREMVAIGVSGHIQPEAALAFFQSVGLGHQLGLLFFHFAQLELQS